MLYIAEVQNSYGESLTLSQNEQNWQIISIKGLNPPPAQVNTTNIAGLDGAKFNSAKLNTRNIVIMLKINGDIESNRQTLYQFFRTKDTCTFFFSNQNRNVSIQGYVETVECDLFTNGEVMQISIVCPYPYFKAVTEIIADISNIIAGFSFPFSINIGEPIAFSTFVESRVVNVVNNSESETGMLITIDFSDAVSTIQISNTDTGDTMTLTYSFQANDRVLINTQKGQKSIKLIRGGVTSNLFSAMAQGSVFFQLRVGSNHFSYALDSGADEDSASVTLAYSNLYRGV